MEFKLNGKKVTPKVTFGLALALSDCNTRRDTIITMFRYSLGINEKTLEALPISCTVEVTAIISYLNEELEK